MGSLLAYTADGTVVATLEHCVALDAQGHAVGLVDFEAHEAAGGEHTDIWVHNNGPDDQVKGSKYWPEWLGSRALGFRVELDGPPGAKRITALVHKTSGHRRERAAIEAAIEAVPVINGVRDIRHLVGGPMRPLHLDEDGQNSGFRPSGSPTHLPRIGRPDTGQ